MRLAVTASPHQATNSPPNLPSPKPTRLRSLGYELRTRCIPMSALSQKCSSVPIGALDRCAKSQRFGAVSQSLFPNLFPIRGAVEGRDAALTRVGNTVKTASETATN